MRGTERPGRRSVGLATSGSPLSDSRRSVAVNGSRPLARRRKYTRPRIRAYWSPTNILRCRLHNACVLTERLSVVRAWLRYRCIRTRVHVIPHILKSIGNQSEFGTKPYLKSGKKIVIKRSLQAGTHLSSGLCPLFPLHSTPYSALARFSVMGSPQ